jgi:3',5'-cyclic-AMP phosphodiesterase
VLGNHDCWHRSFRSVTSEYRQISLCAANAHFLDARDQPVDLVSGIQLCGVSGWYDARCGNLQSRFALNDWWLIEDLNALRVPFELDDKLRKKFRALAAKSAIAARLKLNRTTANHVIFATHVPPFADAAWHLGRRSDDDVLPYYTNIVLGRALNRWAAANPDRKLTTLCGHSHSRGDYAALPNHTVRTAAADYGHPQIEYVFELESL